MSESVTQALGSTLEFLKALSRERVRPAAARQRLRSLQEKLPSLKVNLIWEEEAYAQAVHYDALLRLPGSGTAALSFCADHGVPWPMRGIRSADDSVLLSVNNNFLTMDQALACLDFIWDEAPILTRMINVCLIQAELTMNPVEIPTADLQEAMDAFRRTHRLYQAEETKHWLERRGMTKEKLEEFITDEVAVAKLRERVAGEQAEPYFEKHRADFESLRAARIDFADEGNAREMLGKIQRGEADFYKAAQEQFLAWKDGQSPKHLFQTWRRSDFDGEWGPRLFSARAGDVLGPIRLDASSSLIQVLSQAPAVLDDKTREAIKRLLFEDWLEERRRKATIEWLWGNEKRTSSST